MRSIAYVIVFALAFLSGTASAALKNSVTEWFVQAQRSVALYGTTNQISAKQYALLGLSQYRSLQRLGKYRQFTKAESSRQAKLQTATQAFAAHKVLSALYPSRQTAYDPQLAAHTADLSKHDLDFAEAVANSYTKPLILRRVLDGSTRWSRYVSNTSSAVGAYRFTPGQTAALYPQLADVKPIAVPQSKLEKYIAEALAEKHTIPSAAYYAELDAIKDFGSSTSTNRSEYDTVSARFWADGNTTSAIGGHWVSIAYEVLPANLDLLTTARVFARIGAAAFDASIAVWAVKYRAAFWRPITALRTGDANRTPIPDWTPLLATPPHPEFPSGHQATVGGILAVLKAVVGDVAVTIGSEGVANVTRTYSKLSLAAKEVGDSRFYAGVHFQRANEVGLKLGVKVGKYIAKYLY